MDQDALLTLQSERAAERLGGLAAFAGLRCSLLIPPRAGESGLDALDFTLTIATAFALQSAEQAGPEPEA